MQHIHALFFFCSENSFLDIDFTLDVSTIIDRFESKTTLQSHSNDSLVDEKHSPKSQLTNKIISHTLHFNQSYTSMIATAQLMNQTPGSNVRIPDTIYRIKKSVKPFCEPEFNIQCNICKIFSRTLTTEVKCESCSQTLKRTHSKYFVSLSVRSRIKKTLNDYFDEIIKYDEEMQVQSNMMRDIHDSILYRRVREKYPNAIILPLAVNTDGANAFNSTHRSLWPLQLYQNYLPPKKRYIPENIIVTGFYEGNRCEKNIYF